MSKLYFLLWCLCPLQLLAQSSPPPTFVITSDTSTFQNLPTRYWQIIEDTSSGRWTINTAMDPPVANLFHAKPAFDKNNSYPVNTYWIRFRLKNNMAKPVSVVLQQKSAYADYYIQSGRTWRHLKTGDNRAWNKRDGYKMITAVPVETKPGEEIFVYERLHFDYRIARPKPVEAGFGFTSTVVHDNYVDNDGFIFNTILGSFFIGLLFFAAVFNFFFYLVVHEKVYLYYALCLLFGTLNEYHAIFFQVFFRNHPGFVNINGVFFLLIVNFFAVQMERYFLQTFFHYPRWDKMLRVSLFIQFLAVLAVYFAGPHFPNYIDTVLWTIFDCSQGLVLTCLLTTFLLYVREKDKAARQFVIACLPVATVWVMNYVVVNTAAASIVLEWNKYYQRLELLCISSLVIILSWILFDRYNVLRKENAERAILNERLAKEKEIERRRLLDQQKVVLEKEVAERTAELKQSLEDLKAAQKQLVQSEKMASLGELTAGIAHEIQNPLNFVNNFSELSSELLAELKDGPLSSINNEYRQQAEEVIADLSENLHKIQYHGKRAGAIVKAMLEHSISGRGKKEPTDVNILTEEYLRVSYSRKAAKEDGVHVNIVTDFDKSVEKIDVIQHELGRVLINLFNNAFYSVVEKKKKQFENYQPTLWVSTKKFDGKIRISVRDNGMGMPAKIVDKIFQPFFTTKPAGQGTGLGLSLSYDIIKAQGGELRVESREGGWAEFIVELPVGVTSNLPVA